MGHKLVRVHPDSDVHVRTSRFALRPFARPLSLAGLLVGLLVLFQHLDLRSCHNDWRGGRRRVISSSRPGEGMGQRRVPKLVTTLRAYLAG